MTTNKLRIFIPFIFTDNPYGGGNQFLKALRSYFIKNQLYTDKLSQADCILFNSHHEVQTVAKLKRQYPEKIVIHRIDGPMRIYNSPNDQRDLIVNLANKFLADATIFQSNWSRTTNHKLGLKKKKFEDVILNAPDSEIFNRQNKIPFSTDRKIKLISTSWSLNPNKGFDVFSYLDSTLNFDNYEMVFVGNSPVKFKNIKYIPPQKSADLAILIKEADIFISASIYESCSNSLLEALHCGLPVIVRNSSSNVEVMANAGEKFNTQEEIPALLDKIITNYYTYVDSNKLPTIEQVGESYVNFIQTIFTNCKPSEIKKINYFTFHYLKWKFKRYGLY